MIKIGSVSIKNPYILAPMAGVSQMPFRKISLAMGASLAPTELISAKGIMYQNDRTKSYLISDSAIENPFCVQLFGGDAESMGQAAHYVWQNKAHIIDINMGCPVKKVTKTNAGSALMVDTERAKEIVRSMIKNTKGMVPITAKIRSGFDESSKNYVYVAKLLEEEGISAIAMHARTRSQGYSGKADWSLIKDLKKSVKIPVIGNGDIDSFKSAQKMLDYTGCDAVMIGRAALGNPWIFKECILNDEYKPSSEEKTSIILNHLEDHIAFSKMIHQQKKFAIEIAIKSFRSHLIWYSRNMAGGALFRKSIMDILLYDELVDYIIKFFSNESLAFDEEVELDYRQAFG